MTQKATTPAVKEATPAAPPKKQLNTNQLFSEISVQNKFEKLLGEKSAGFISSVLQVINDNKVLKKASPSSVLNAAATAAALDLPINNNLGFAWIVPYKGQAQFQIGWKGLVQLALRTGMYKRINVVPIFENQFTSYNALTEELVADFLKEGKGKVVGYAAYIRLKSGFEKLSYWTTEKVTAHAKKYSKAYGTNHSPWSDKDQFDAMAMKTVLKNTLNKYGIMSIDMGTAIESDQSVQEEEGVYEYPDNEAEIEDAKVVVEKKKADIKANKDNPKGGQQKIDMP